MMNKTAVLLMMCCSLTAWSNDLATMSLAGKVKTITEETCTYSEVSDKPVLNNEWISKWTCSFDERGNKVDEVMYTGIFRTKCLFTYDMPGKLIRQVLLNDAGDNGTISDYDYDGEGRLIGERIHDDTLNTDVMYSYSYDTGKNTVTKEARDKGVVLGIWVETYNPNGHMIKESKYGDDKKLVDQYLYNWNDAGNMIREVFLDEDGSLRSESICEYDTRGNKTKETIQKYDTPSMPPGTTVWLYEYDSTGNWTKRTMCDALSPTTLVPQTTDTRVITYY